MRKLLKILILLVVLLILTSTVLLFAAIQDMPLVKSSSAANVENALNARTFVRSTINKVLYAKEPVVVTIKTTDLDNVINLASHALPRLQVYASIEPATLLGAATFRVSKNPFGNYLNSSVYILPSRSGLEIESIQIGSLTINGWLGLHLIRFALDMLLGDRQGSLFLDAIQEVSLQSGEATIVIDPPANMQTHFSRIKHRFKSLRDKANIYGDPKLVQHYYSELIYWANQYGDEENISLTRYLVPLFAEARWRTDAGSNASKENRAAILALSIFLGDSRFEKLIGPVRNHDMRNFKPPHKVQLANRTDLRLHFIYSAALKILAEQGVSVAMGEYKELTDSGTGGSGFSFVDLAADRSGIYFAERATANEFTARQVQSRIADGISDADILPSTEDLPEGLSQKQFTDRYGNVESAAYQSVVDEIDQRINALSLYRP